MVSKARNCIWNNYTCLWEKKKNNQQNTQQVYWCRQGLSHFILFAAYITSSCLTCFSLFPCSSLRLSCHHLSRLVLPKAELPQGSNRNQTQSPVMSYLQLLLNPPYLLLLAAHSLTPLLCLSENNFRFCKVLNALLQYVELEESKTAIASGSTKK